MDPLIGWFIREFMEMSDKNLGDFSRFRGVLASNLLGNLTNTCQNMRALSPQKLIYVALQESCKLLINPWEKKKKEWSIYRFTLLLVDRSYPIARGLKS